MADITPSLLETVETDFANSLATDKKYLRLVKRVESGRLDWDLANDYSIRLGELLSGSLNRYITAETLPDGRFYFNIAKRILSEVLHTNHSLIADVSERVQMAQNEKAKIGMKAIRPEFNDDRLKGLIDKLSNAENFTDVQWLLNEPIVNFSQSVVDDTIETNAKAQAQAGLRVTLYRRAEGGCCEWCNSLAGIYHVARGGELPHEVFQRHERCRCHVSYNGQKLKPYLTNTFRADT